ncbi:hypothetical protein VTN00DRAFT_933 [Thermoascus crustaceus]|uniref:uncharacterized protein n=1 Tax=Thermoascus crustaceus TaxID=5088 RepID=UPI003742D26B
MLFADKDYPFFVWAVINGSHARASPARGATALFSLHADRKFAVVDKVERLLEYEAKLTRLGDSSPITSAEWPREGTIIRNTHWGILKDDLVLKSYGPFNAGFLVMRLKCPDSEQ